MKRMLLALSLLCMIFLVSCNNYDGLDYYFGEYQVYYESHGNCEMYINELIYEDDEAMYFLGAGGCGGEHFYYIKYNKEYIDITYALKEEIIDISDVVQSGIPALMIDEK